ncbi:MAG: DNA polymerase III subunit gamma/tau [Christensenellaceae bacterium]|jgi:DNA polymerase-3 subunit gamma/tau|nr:DNA polymerase III subunit gamma/tau [Christensenellaceae bacterium]
METTSLYRAYRPKTFAQVVGQEPIVKILQNQIKANKIAHAYLFCGSRGTGKTTVAKIFARAMTDEIDTFEIDAASNNSVGDVRDLVDKVKYPPVRGKYKVYIIDEVHMFSTSAFNAFLKTLEEPPAHIVFILCTTEPSKILPTIQSRCLRFDFRPATDKDIKKVLTDVFKKEDITATDDATDLIVTAGSGSYRDALSTAETVISYCGGKQITANDVTAVLGTVSPELLKSLLGFIRSGELKNISKTVSAIFEKGINTNLLVKNFIETIKTELLAGDKVTDIFKTFCELELTIKNSPDPKVHFENTCLVACGNA